MTALGQVSVPILLLFVTIHCYKVFTIQVLVQPGPCLLHSELADSQHCVTTLCTLVARHIVLIQQLSVRQARVRSD